MDFRIRTLTPLWTGDVRGESSKLRETSIIGSLRWWFEVIIRGLGGGACDSVSEVVRKCELKGEEYKRGVKPEKLICPVCYIFGTTGWSRRFKLEINGKLSSLRPVIVKADMRKNHKGWFLGTGKSGGLMGTLEVRIYGKPWVCNILALVLSISCSWGIGSKTQDGFGICKLEEKCVVDETINKIKDLIGRFKRSQNGKLLPNIKDCFFVKITVKDDINDNIKEAFDGKLKNDSQMSVEEFLQSMPKYGNKFYPTAPLIRYWLRSLFRNGDNSLRHFLFGFVSIKGDPTPICKVHLTHVNKKGGCPKCGRALRNEEVYKRMGSKIFVSHIYNVDGSKWEFKIWGYVPKVLPNNEDREKILQKLFSEIKENKGFVNVLNLDRNSTDVKWYEVSDRRANISSVEELISAILEVDRNE